jgi:hypothetical protein
MTTTVVNTADIDPISESAQIAAMLRAALDAQREDYLEQGAVSAATRIDRIDRGIDVLLKFQHKLVDALNTDFSCRSRQVTLLTDIAASLTPMKHARKHLHTWMKSQRRPSSFPFNLLGGRSHIEYQPLGVVGVISPWNFPVNLTFGPLAGILAAGNRVMIRGQAWAFLQTPRIFAHGEATRREGATRWASRGIGRCAGNWRQFCAGGRFKIRDATKQRDCVRMPGCAEDFLDKAGFNDASRIHHGNPIRLPRHHAKIMRDQHHGHAIRLTQIRQQVQNLRLHGHIQRGSWFIGDQHARA